MIKAVSRMLGLFTIIVVITGCKLAVIVVEGGEVQSTGSGTCLVGSVCLHEITDTNFRESFTAVADDGWVFVRWHSADSFFCGEEDLPTCTLTNDESDGDELVESIVASDRTFYIMPVFEKITAAPITQTVTVQGREWAQPRLFEPANWQHVDNLCPGGACSGTLNGYDISGWQWATLADVNALFNFYIGTNELGPGVGVFQEANSGWAQAFLNDGWQASVDLGLGRGVLGWTTLKGYLAEVFQSDVPFITPDGIGTSSIEGPGVSETLQYAGVWLYRD